MKAIIVLEDGTYFEGISFGATGERAGEVVFNTSMTGYQEILTDPSYRGQIVTMTYPLIGNYGVNPEDVESRKPFLQGFVVKEVSKIISNWRATESLQDYLKRNDILGIEGVDTRALTRHIRIKGAMKGIISTKNFDVTALKKQVIASPGLDGRDLVSEVTIDKKYKWNKNGIFNVVAIDCGIKYHILRNLAARSCKVEIVPYQTSAREIMDLRPDGIFLSNGPGDPAAVAHVVSTIQDLFGKAPIFGICLGHQMLGQALGGKTFKLKFGHHGANHPVKDLRTGKIAITAQNHGYCVDIDTLNKKEVELTHINLNDQTLEGIRLKKLPVFSVQYHPEAGPGPHDPQDLFDEFVDLMKNSKKRKKK